jgi:hypothetical protein
MDVVFLFSNAYSVPTSTVTLLVLIVALNDCGDPGAAVSIVIDISSAKSDSFPSLSKAVALQK